MNRYAVRIGSILALALSAQIALPARADTTAYTYNGKRIAFQTLRQPSGLAVSADDPALRDLVRAAGASLSWDPDNQYVLITFPGPSIISFAIGDPHYLDGSVSHPAEFAPFVRDSHAYVPLDDVLRALKLPPLSGSTDDLAPPPTPPPFSGTPAPSPQPQQLAQVTGVDVQTSADGVTVRIGVTGNGAYDWHRLRPPDNRWWIDLHNARLGTAPMDQNASGPVASVRLHQQSPDTVRVALSLAAFDEVTVTPQSDGVTVVVTNRQLADAPRSGSGTFGSIVTAAVTPAASPAPSPTRYVPANPKLIAIDPGHGGSDPGTVRNGTSEKELTLDMARRLRDILIARGWQVVMTRTDDRDVFAPDDSARDELQARDDVANSRGARLLVSIHVNSYTNAGPHGAATYYYKSTDVALARALSARIGSELDLKNNGIIKDKLYVVNHAAMPAALVETAYMSNPDDLALLLSSAWRQKMAQAIADGIADYTENN